MNKAIFSIIINILYPAELYVALQMLDQVGIVDTETMEVINLIEIDIMESDSCMNYSQEQCDTVNGCEWSMGMCMESGGTMMGSHTPHFIAIDEIHNDWFVTTIASGYVARHNLTTNEMIDKIFVGDSPALISLNKINKKLYCSRMMPMGEMMSGAISTIIQEIDYSGEMMVNSQEFEIPSPAPHGLSINSDGSEIYVTSNTADWVYKIITETGEIIGSAMDSIISNPSDLVTQRLKPIQCLSVADSLLFITCSGGIWIDPWTGIQEQIPGQVQLWKTDVINIGMQLIKSYEYNWTSTPWHLIKSPNSNHIYVVLSGDQLYEGSAGVSKLSYAISDTISMMDEEWFSGNVIFNTLHGIDISPAGDEIYVSGRGDGYLHTIQTSDGQLMHSIPLSNNLSMVMAGGVATNYSPYLISGDINFDGIVGITDLVSLISSILGNSQISEVAQYNGDWNQDSILNILDIMGIVNYILDS